MSCLVHYADALFCRCGWVTNLQAGYGPRRDQPGRGSHRKIQGDRRLLTERGGTLQYAQDLAANYRGNSGHIDLGLLFSGPAADGGSGGQNASAQRNFSARTYFDVPSQRWVDASSTDANPLYMIAAVG